MTGEPDSASTFDLDHYLSLPRVAGLVLDALFGPRRKRRRRR